MDLNPIRAGIAATPEASNFTSVQDRIVDLTAAAEECSADSIPCTGKAASSPDFEDVSVPERRQFDAAVEHGPRAGWLAPIPLEPKRQAVRTKKTARRASNKGCLSIGLGDYLQLLDWTGRQIRADKRGAISENLQPLFERLEISSETWVDCVVNFRRWFRSSVGRPKSMEASAKSKGHNRAISITAARRAFNAT